MNRRRATFSLVFCIAVVLSGARSAVAQSHPAMTRPAREVNLLALGDWGEDTTAERQVAAAMARYVRENRIALNAVLLLGDNFYFRLTGVDDPRWGTLFERMYDSRILNVPFIACLGNHDYDGNNRDIELAYARGHPESRFKMPSPWYRVDLPRDHPLVTLLMLNSNKDNLTDVQWNQQIAWIKTELDGPRAAWTICCAHHPMFSNGFFLFNGILQRDWGRLFEKAGVDFYLTGHEHNLQHLEMPGWHETFLIAGGGGAHPHPLYRADRGFSREQFGFVHLALDPDRAIVRFIGVEGHTIHEFERTKAGQVRILETDPNSTPRRSSLQTYLELKNRQPSSRP